MSGPQSPLKWKCLLAGFFSSVCIALTGTAAPNRPPNIVVIVADDLGYGDLGCYGATKIKTPNVDRLAKEGVRFTQAYAPASTCTPSRYSLLTGDYAWRQTAKKTTILDGDAPLAIEPGTWTLPEMLRRAGYATGVVGKWHLGLGDGKAPVDFNRDVKPGPLEVGFDYSYIIPATVDRVPTVWLENHRVVNLDPKDPISVSYLTNFAGEPTGLTHPKHLKEPADRQHSGTIVNGISRIGFMKGGAAARFVDEELHRTTVAKAGEFIEKHRQGPFFLYVGLFEPHVPRVAGSPFGGQSGCGLRGDVIQQMDWEVGEIMAALDRLKLTDDTVVLFTSDNGPILFDGYFDGAAENTNGHLPAGGLRGWKYLVYEGGTRVPLIALWPNHIAHRVSDRMFCLTDVLRTCAAVTGAKVPAGVGRDSLNQLPELLGTSDKQIRSSVVQQGISGAFAVRQGPWKYIPANAGASAGGMGSGADPNDKRFADAIIPKPLLFNLDKDPGETNNVITSFPGKSRELAHLLEETKAATPLSEKAD